MNQVPTALIISTSSVSSLHEICRFVFMSLFVMLTACSPSGRPKSEELIKTRVPSFAGLNSTSFVTSTTDFVISGECDPISVGLEYQYSNTTTWTTIPTGCVNGAFTFNIVVPKQVFVYVRARTKKGWTGSALADIRLLLPPTSPAFQVVTAGSAVDAGSPGVQYTMGVLTGDRMAVGTRNIDVNVTGIVYGP